PILRCHARTSSLRKLAGQRQYTPTGRADAPQVRTTRARQRTSRCPGGRGCRAMRVLHVQRGLFLCRWKRPRGPRPPLLAEHEPQLLRWSQLSLVGAERRARLRQVECAKEVLAEEAFLAAHLPGTSLAVLARHSALPPRCELERNE